MKQNKDNSLDWLLEHAMVPLDHLFDNHHLCFPTWCYIKVVQDKVITPEKDLNDQKSQRVNLGYYPSTDSDKDLYLKNETQVFEAYLI